MDKETYLRIIAREKKARKEAERILEDKALELYQSNLKLTNLLESQVNALNDSERKYQNIFESAFDGIVFISNTGKVMDYNKKFKELVGFSSDEMNRLDMAELVHPEDVEKSKEYLKRLQKEGFYRDYRGRMITKNNGLRTIEVNSIAIYEEGEMVGSVDIIRDVTERVKTEELLFASGQRFKALFDNTPVGIIINSNQGEYIDINMSMLSMIGYSKSEFEKMELKEVIHEEDYEAIRDRIFDIRNGSTKLQTLETRFLHKSGETVWVKVNATFIGDRVGGQTQLISLIEDITAWKKSNMLLGENEEKWRFVINNMELGLMEVDLEGRATKIYDKFCEITGYSEEDLLGKIPLDVLVQDEKNKQIFLENLAIREAGSPSSYELEIVKKNGETAWLLVSGAPLKDDKQNMVGSIGIHMDISVRKKMLRELEEAKLIAEESSKAKENFLANMSHEIRTPMNAVIGMTRLLKESNNQEDKVKYLEAIETSSQNLLVLINDVLDISKIEANKLQIDSIPFDLKKVIKDIELLLSFKAEESGNLFSFELDESIYTSLIGDAIRLSQILTNLISNAIKFTDNGTVMCKVTLVKEEEQEVRLKFCVVDNGKGISADKLDKIFESFSQEDQTISRKYGGTGLGLAITKSLVELQGGTISVTSDRVNGTKFSFEIDYTKNFEETREEQEVQKGISLQKVEKAKVLLVEDHEINKLLAETLLTSWKMEVTHAYNGQEALDLLEENNYDIVLMDVQMPVMDGFTATRILRERNITTPVIALTANAIKGDEKKCLDAGMDGYVSKPIDASLLFNKIVTHLNHE